MSEQENTIANQEAPENIETQVAAWSQIESELREMSANSKAITIMGHIDGPDAGFKVTKTARLYLKSYRVSIEKRRKELKENVLKVGQLIDGTAKKLIAIIEPDEERLEAMEKEYELAQAEEKRKKEEEKKRKLNERVQAMQNLGLPIDLDLCQNATNEAFAALISTETEAKRIRDETAEAERQEAARIAEENRIKQEQEAQAEVERKRLADEESKRIADAQAAEARRIREEAAELQRQKDELAKEKQRIKEEADALEAKKNTPVQAPEAPALVLTNEPPVMPEVVAEHIPAIQEPLEAVAQVELPVIQKDEPATPQGPVLEDGKPNEAFEFRSASSIDNFRLINAYAQKIEREGDTGRLALKISQIAKASINNIIGV